jgi:hypothetical protein
MHLHYEHLRILGEAGIARARPGGSLAAAYGLVMAGLIVISMSPKFLLLGFIIEFTTGFIEARYFVWIGLGIVALGAACLVVAWGVSRGFLWGWFGAELLTVLCLALAWSITETGWPILNSLAAVLVVDHLAIQFMLWRSSVRSWFSQSHRVRARGYEGVAVVTEALR